MLVLIVLMTGVLLLLPVTLRVDGAHETVTRLDVTLRYVKVLIRWRLTDMPGGRRLVRLDTDGTPLPVRPHPQRRHRIGLMLRTLARADHARRFLLRHLRLQALDGLVSLHTEDAAHTALLSGGMDALARLPRLFRSRIRLRVLPDFFRGDTRWQLRCIIRPRLGTLIITALMLLAAWAAAQHQLSKEAETWNIPSEN